MYVDVKVTMWKRVELPDEMPIEEAVAILEGPDPINSFFDSELWEKYPDFSFDYEEVENTEEDMTIEENDNQSTLELKDDDGKTLWENYKS